MGYCRSTGYYIRQPVSLLLHHSRIRKRGGNNKETTSLQLASDVPCNQGNHSVVKTTNLFLVYSGVYMVGKREAVDHVHPQGEALISLLPQEQSLRSFQFLCRLIPA